MLTLPLPVHSARSTFSTCISLVRNTDLKRRLKDAIETVVFESSAYDKAAARHTLHEIIAIAIVAPDVTTEEMKKVYNDRMAKAGSPGRAIYDDIIGAAPQGRCPLCGQRSVSTLDHLLPKAHYPALAVTPSNLVPACKDCNIAKLAFLPRYAEDVSLHPYYDDLGGDRWLFAEVRKTQPASLRFKVIPPVSWNSVLTARVKNHFTILGLRALYASEAAEELTNIRYQLSGIYKACGMNGVRNELHQRAVSCDAGRRNGWRAATYYAWAESDWFYNGGFEPPG